MPERDIESLGVMGWGLVVAENSSAAAAVVAVVAPGGGGGESDPISTKNTYF